MLDLPAKEAAERLKKGTIDFILKAPPERMGELARLHPAAPFYAGLLVREAAASATGAAAAAGTEGAEGAKALSAALFEAALESPSAPVREAAARELILPLLEKDLPPERVLALLTKKNRPPPGAFELSARGAALYSLGRPGELAKLYEKEGPRTSWDRAFSALEAGEVLPFLASGSFDGAYRWALGRAQERGLIQGAAAAAALGRQAVSRSAFGEALRQFREVLEQEKELFFRYPDLIGDLGRAFQFAGTGDEGLRLFLEWEREAGWGDQIRYLLLYYGGRMARQLGRPTQGIELFTGALRFAPDPLQEDACIWYILSLTLANRPEDAAPRFKAYLPRWNDPPYFADLLDQLSRYLMVKGQWQTLGEIFSLIRPLSDGGSTARYAWILGRALEEGYFPQTGAAPLAAPEDFFKIAFEAGGASFYYRALSAARLGEAVLIPEETPAKGKAGPPSPPSAALEFLLGFFEYGAGGLVSPYLYEGAAALDAGELRAVAEAFDREERWAEAIRLVSFYMARPGYEPRRRDLELNYPRAYGDLIDKYAEAVSLSPPVLFGLIRTESAFVPGIVSRAGAVGLSQLMDATAREMAGRISRQGGPDYRSGGSIDLADPAVNIHIGAYYLRYLIDQMGSPVTALLAYNGGMGRVRRWRAAAPSLPEDLFLETVEYPETREYGRRVLAAAAAYGCLYYGLSMEAVVHGTGLSSP